MPMPVLIEQNRNTKEATHIITEKRKKKQRSTAKNVLSQCQRDKVKMLQKFSSPIVLDGFFFKKKSKHFHWLARV